VKEREGDKKGRGWARVQTDGEGETRGEMGEGGHLRDLKPVGTEEGEEHSNAFEAFEEWVQVRLGVIDEEGEMAEEVGGLQQVAPC
jgi:hypothetical protein